MITAIKRIIDKLGYDAIEKNYVENEGEELSDAPATWPSFRRMIIYNTILLIISLISLAASTILFQKAFNLHEQYDNRNNLFRSTVYYSPLTEADIPFEAQKFTSPPLSSTKYSIYRQPPSPVVDTAWERLTDIGTHIISSSDVRRLGKDPSKAVRVPESWGYGPDAHIATLDGIHLVHCLNSIRKSLHINFDYYHKEPLGPEYVPHLTHCVEAVLQHLMCKPSMELLTQNWIERQYVPFPDFAVNKKCWNYEAILDWKEKHRVLDIERRFEELKPPNGTVLEPLPPLVAETWENIEERRRENVTA